MIPKRVVSWGKQVFDIPICLRVKPRIFYAHLVKYKVSNKLICSISLATYLRDQARVTTLTKKQRMDVMISVCAYT